MQARKQIKEEHEFAVIKAFVSWYNLETSQDFRIVSKPDPPDAILQNGSIRLWIEHADVYRGAEEAREEYSYVTPGETPYNHCEHPILEPDERIATVFVGTLHKKLTKESYGEFFEKLGKGILLLTERDRLFSESTLECIQDKLVSYNFTGNCGYFRNAYIGYWLSFRNAMFFKKIYPYP